MDSITRFLLLISLPLAMHAVTAGEKTVTIGLIGDSTVATTYGWGLAFSDRFNTQVTVLNYAVNGATLDSLSNNLDSLLQENPHYVLIQFGHNDMKRYDAQAYRTKLESYVERVTQAGSNAIVLSSVTRRNFDDEGKISPHIMHGDRSLPAFALSAESVAKDHNVPFIDLNSISIRHHNEIGPEASAAYNFNESDRTHFSKEGAKSIADLILNELKAAVPELEPYLKAERD